MPLHTDFNLSGAAFFINMDDTNDFFYIGYISRSRGLKGEIQLFFEFSDYEELDLDVLFLEMDRKMVPFFVDTAKIQQNSTAYIFLEDIDHIEKAQPLLHKRVYLPKAKRPERDPEDFRFTDLVGDPPMRYLLRWRMQLAARRLSDTRDPVARVAFDAGYESEAAFNRAFKRVFGVPPATWRKERTLPPAS